MICLIEEWTLFFGVGERIRVDYSSKSFYDSNVLSSRVPLWDYSIKWLLLNLNK